MEGKKNFSLEVEFCYSFPPTHYSLKSYVGVYVFFFTPKKKNYFTSKLMKFIIVNQGFFLIFQGFLNNKYISLPPKLEMC